MSLHRRIRCPRPMAGSRHRCHHQSPPQSTTLAPHHRHPSRRRHRHRRDPIPGDTQAWLDAVHDARQRHWMSRVGELCARSTREVRSAAPGPYGGTSPNGCCFGFCPSSMIYVREREVYPNAPIVLMAVVAFRARRAVAAPASVERVGPRCPLSPPGPLFKLDIDSFWQAADGMPEFDAVRVRP